jgi:hypothetical protein
VSGATLTDLSGEEDAARETARRFLVDKGLGHGTALIYDVTSFLVIVSGIHHGDG